MGETSKNNELFDKLVMLEEEEKSVIRNINIYYRNTQIKNRLFKRFKEIKKDIKKTKFKIKMESEIRKNDKDSNSSQS